MQTQLFIVCVGSLIIVSKSSSQNLSPLLFFFFFFFGLLSSTPPPLSPSAPLQVLLMQESVRRIIEAEESKMGEGILTHTNSKPF